MSCCRRGFRRLLSGALRGMDIGDDHAALLTEKLDSITSPAIPAKPLWAKPLARRAFHCAPRHPARASGETDRGSVGQSTRAARQAPVAVSDEHLIVTTPAPT